MIIAYYFPFIWPETFFSLSEVKDWLECLRPLLHYMLPILIWRAFILIAVCQNMSYSTSLTHEEMEKLNSWNMKSVIQCPSCKSNAFNSRASNQYFQFDWVGDNVIKVSHHNCPYILDSNRWKNKYICLSCGKGSVHSKRRLMKSCTCQKTNCSNAGQISENESERITKDVSDSQHMNEQSIFSNLDFFVDNIIFAFKDECTVLLSVRWGCWFW